MAETIFGRILKGEIPAPLLHSDEHCIAIADINPAAPFHVLVIPRKPLVNVGAAGAEDTELLGHLQLVGAALARKAGWPEFRMLTNSGADAGQSVMHLHLHVLAGRSLCWPPG